MCIRDRPSASVQPALLTVREAYADEKLDLTEGVKVLWPDGSWLHVRPSNTEPIVRIIAEADTLEPVSYTHLDVYKRQQYS